MRRTCRSIPANRQRVENIIAEFRVGLRELRCVASERFVRQGIRMSHVHLMSMLQRHGDMAMSRVADLLGFSLSNATGLIDRMVERGLVERVRIPGDRRVVLVRLTERGQEVLAEAEDLSDDLLDRVLATLDEVQIERVAGAMNDLRAAITAVRAAEVPEPEDSRAHH